MQEIRNMKAFKQVLHQRLGVIKSGTILLSFLPVWLCHKNPTYITLTLMIDYNLKQRPNPLDNQRIYN